jgi:plasmid stabilization system protein ParE
MRPAARNDLGEIVDYYEQQKARLGRQFLAALVSTLEFVVERPSSFPEVCADVRRARLTKFPYGVFFRFTPDTIQVIAIMHLHRDPGAWRRRV